MSGADAPSDDTPAPALASPGFIHLRIHSAYSLLEGALPLAKIIGFAEAQRMPAIGIADTGNLFGALEFAQKASGAGIQPIVGCQLVLNFDGDLATPRPANGRQVVGAGAEPVVLIAATGAGYANLVELVSSAYLDTDEQARTQISAGWLAERADGIICLTGGPGGPVGAMLSEGHPALAEARLRLLKECFGDRLYVELQRHKGYDKAVERQTVELAYRLELPLVATNEAFFLKRDDFEAHDALIAIAEGSLLSIDDRRRLTPDHWLKPETEMVKLFADLPEAAANTVEIARRCSYFPQTGQADRCRDLPPAAERRSRS